MPKINILDRETAELIAAGEVIERPASVVKELVENSIDAGATAITVEIGHGGVRLIRVTDNGCGIEREDVPKAFLRHATSKVLRPEDLDRIGTLGFRGEALASICAVSETEILTRAATEEIGTRYTLAGECAGELAEAGCPVGTTITAKNLFYNVPARMKFLKKDSTEGTAVATLMDRLALSHPEIAFKLIRDREVKLATPAAATCWRPFLRCMAMNLAGVSSRWSVRTGPSGSAATWQGRNAAGPPAAWSTFSSTIAM